MTENQNVPSHPQHPPVQPQPQAPAGIGQPQYQQPYQGQPGYGQSPYPVQGQPQQYAPAYVPAYPAVAAGPRSSGYRLAAGIVMTVLGFWMLISSFTGISSYSSSNNAVAVLLLLTLIASAGTLATGIVLLIKQRARTRALPIIVLCVAGVDLLLSFFGMAATAAFLFAFLMTVPVLIVMGIGLSRETRGL